VRIQQVRRTEAEAMEIYLETEARHMARVAALSGVAKALAEIDLRNVRECIALASGSQETYDAWKRQYGF
jgi:hypothetical protein